MIFPYAMKIYPAIIFCYFRIFHSFPIDGTVNLCHLFLLMNVNTNREKRTDQ